MLPRIFSLVAWLGVASLLGLAACTPKQVGVISANNQGTQVAFSVNVNQSTQPGSVEPGTAEEPGVAGESGGTIESGPTPSTTQVFYTDAKYTFSVPYPSNFVFRTLPAGKLASQTPKPQVVYLIMNPTTASSQVTDEPGTWRSISTMQPGQPPWIIG